MSRSPGDVRTVGGCVIADGATATRAIGPASPSTVNNHAGTVASPRLVQSVVVPRSTCVTWYVRHGDGVPVAVVRVGFASGPVGTGGSGPMGTFFVSGHAIGWPSASCWNANCAGCRGTVIVPPPGNAMRPGPGDAGSFDTIRNAPANVIACRVASDKPAGSTVRSCSGTKPFRHASPWSAAAHCCATCFARLVNPADPLAISASDAGLPDGAPDVPGDANGDPGRSFVVCAHAVDDVATRPATTSAAAMVRILVRRRTWRRGSAAPTTHLGWCDRCDGRRRRPDRPGPEPAMRGGVHAGRFVGENGRVSFPRQIVLLGSTGSVGSQAVEIVRANPERFRVAAIGGGGGNVEL